MKPGKFASVTAPLLLLATYVFLAAQEPQAPPGNSAAAAPKPAAAQPARGRPDMARAFFGLSAAPDPAAVDRGQALFVANCGFCHGSSGNGGNGGPNLVRSVLVLHDEGTGTQIGPVILNGRLGRGMPKFNFTQAQVLDVAAFLLSRSQSTVNRMDYKILNVVTGDPAAGQKFFTANCASCHSASGDLNHIAAKFEPSVLQSRMLYPVTRTFPGVPGPPPDPRGQTTVTVTSRSGAIVSGVLDQIDDFNVSLTDASGEHHSYPLDGPNAVKLTVHDPLKGHEELLTKYSDADMHNILAYLETLK